MSQELQSLQFAKYQVWKKLELDHGLIYGTYLKKSKYDQLYQIVFSRFDVRTATRLSYSTLKSLGKDEHLHRFKMQFPSNFFVDCYPTGKNKYSSAMIRLPGIAFIFDRICEASDEGMKFVLDFKATAARTKERIVFLEPYQGTKLQIEADLMSPDYTSMDEPLPF